MIETLHMTTEEEDYDFVKSNQSNINQQFLLTEMYQTTIEAGDRSKNHYMRDDKNSKY